MSWEDCGGDTRRLRVPGGWIYKIPEPYLSAVFVPEPSKVTAENRTDYQRGWDDGYKVTVVQSDGLDWERGHKAGYRQATADEKAKIDELILSLQNVLELIDDNEKSYAQSHINGIITALRSEI